MVLNNCNVCAVHIADNPVPPRIRVKCIGEHITLHLWRQKELPEAERIQIDFFDERIGCVKTYCELRIRPNYDSSVEEPWVADCDILEVEKIVQERRDIRVKTEKEMTFTSFERGEFTGVIHNVSAGGLYFVTTTRLKCGDTIEFTHRFVEKEYQFLATVLREEDFLDGKYGYGCQFLEFPEGAKREIQQYVFLVQNGRVW